MSTDWDLQADWSEQLTKLIPRLRRFASGLAGNTDRGDELVQAACERLLGSQGKLRPDTRLDSWLFRVIRNLHIDGLRATSVRERNAQQLKVLAEYESYGRDVLDSQLRLHEVNKAMQQLPEEQRSALMLVCVEGLSYKEAADVLQVPMGTVTSRLVRGRKALIALLQSEQNEQAKEVAG